MVHDSEVLLSHATDLVVAHNYEQWGFGAFFGVNVVFTPFSVPTGNSIHLNGTSYNTVT